LNAATAKTRAVVLAWLCTFAIAFQCIVVQSHVHGAAPRPAELQSASASIDAAPIQAKADPARKQAPSNEKQSGCFICQQMAMAGAAVLPASATPVQIERQLARQPAATEVAVAGGQVSHTWRSRAPPLSLQV
jgi:hypothetical protein